ncbi:MAG: aminopeptidase [Firmicutes bacterium]|nr:aminopeptidase [Bacillota bacterium]
MELNTYLEEYARLLVYSGLNVKAGQVVVVRAPVEAFELVRRVTKKAYEAGASNVLVKYNDEVVSHERYQNALESVFEHVYEHDVCFLNDTAREKACYLTLVGDDPDLMGDIDPKRVSTYTKKFRSLTKYWRKQLDFMECQWCIGAVATPAWAKKVYPNCSEQEAMEKLWDSIFKMTRVYGDSVANWEAHKQSFEKKVRLLNEMKVKSFHYSNALGTDLEVEMPEDYVFAGGGSSLNDGTYYFPNIPTEEVFSCPKKTGVNGKLVASLPLCYNGALIEEFSFEFKDGCVVNYDAKKGKEVLQSILETDEGSKYLGEIAFVPYGSPISLLNTIFYETLIDENASCHFALGTSYAECIKGGLEMSEEELLEHGANQSFAHVDFMVGTSDLTIIAKCADGKEVPIFVDGKYTQVFD